MVLSDLILGWSQLVTGHADSSIISYLKMLHVRFSLWCLAVKWVMTAHFNSEGSPWQTVAPREEPAQSTVVDFGINSLWENQTDIQTHVTKKEKFQQQHVTGAMECTVNGRYYSLSVMHWEKTLHVLPLLSLIYADLFNRCFFFSYQCKSTPLQVWKDKKSHVNLLPPRFLPTLWPNLMA